MMKLLFLTLVVVVSLIQLVKSQCDEGMIKRMAVEVCGLKKRSIDTIFNALDSDFGIKRQYRQISGYDDAPDFLRNFNQDDDFEIERQYRQLSENDYALDYLRNFNQDDDYKMKRRYRQLTGDDDAPDYHRNFNEDDDFKMKRRYRQLTGDDDAPDYHRKDVEDNHDGNILFRRKKSKGKDIQDLVKECCYRKCTADDFRGICGY